jgi:hypothetical protein
MSIPAGQDAAGVETAMAMDPSVPIMPHKGQNRLVAGLVFGLGVVLLGGGLALWWTQGEAVFIALVSSALAWCF